MIYSFIKYYRRIFLNAKQKHEKWLRKMGVHPSQLKSRKTSVYSIPDYKTKENFPLSNKIPANGTKSCDISKSKFCNENYATVPAYNKGPVMLVTKEDLKQGAGRKL